jgi:hypothetical protein
MAHADLIRHKGGVFYFRVRTGADDAYREIAVSELEATLARAADAALFDDAPLVERARYLAEERAHFGAILPPRKT